MHDDRVVVVDEDGGDGRRKRFVQQVAAHVHDVERAGAGRDEVGALEALRRLGEDEARAVDASGPGHAPSPRERGQGKDRPDAAAAVLVALEPVTHADRRRREGGIPLGERLDLALGDAADPRGLGRRVAPRARHELVEALNVALDEAVVEGASPLQLRRDGPGEDHVGAWPERDVKIGLLGDLDPLGVDHHDLGAVPLRLVDDGHEVEVRPRDVVAPHDDELRVRGLLGPDARHRAVGARPGLGADAAAQGLSVEQGRAEAMEEAQIHRGVGEHAMRTRIVEGQHGLRPVGGDGGRHARVDEVERFLPGDPLEASLALGPHPAKRRREPARPVHEVRIQRLDLGAEHARGQRVGARAAHLDHAIVLDRHGEAARVRAVEGADARFLGDHGTSRVVRIVPRWMARELVDDGRVI